MNVPLEIYDRIIGFTDFLTSIKLHHRRAAAQLYDEEIHSWYWAASEGHLDVLKWLHKNNKDQELSSWENSCDVFSAALESGNLKVVKWLYKNRPEMEYSIFNANDTAVERGDLELEIWSDRMIARLMKEERRRKRLKMVQSN